MTRTVGWGEVVTKIVHLSALPIPIKLNPSENEKENNDINLIFLMYIGQK